MRRARLVLLEGRFEVFPSAAVIARLGCMFTSTDRFVLVEHAYRSGCGRLSYNVSQ